MKLPQTTGLESNKGSRDGGADREVGGVNLVKGATISGHGFGIVLKGPVDVGVVAAG